jgi:hypothetical protein
MFARRRPLLRAAVVGGGAFMAGRAAANRSAERADQDARISDLESQQQQQPEHGQLARGQGGRLVTRRRAARGPGGRLADEALVDAGGEPRRRAGR